MIKFAGKKDVFILALVLLLGVALLLPRFIGTKQGQVAVVTVKGEQVAVFDLTTAPPQTFCPTVSPALTVEVKDGAIRFADAHCPDKLCVNSGWLSQPGETAACLPAGVAIYITHSDGAVDAITY